MALLRRARGLTRLLPSLHFSLWPLPLSAAPCLGKMRVSCARWRVLLLPWGGGVRAGDGSRAHQCRFRRGHRRQQRGFRKRALWGLRSWQRQGFPRASTGRSCQVRGTGA